MTEPVARSEVGLFQIHDERTAAALRQRQQRKHTLILDDYEAANLLAALRMVKEKPCALVGWLDTGDWYLQVTRRLEELHPATRPNDVRESDEHTEWAVTFPEATGEWDLTPMDDRASAERWARKYAENGLNGGIPFVIMRRNRSDWKAVHEITGVGQAPPQLRPLCAKHKHCIAGDGHDGPCSVPAWSDVWSRP